MDISSNTYMRILNYLSEHPNGVLYEELLSALESEEPDYVLSDALNEAVNKGAVRIGYQRGVPSKRWDGRPANILFYHGADMALIHATQEEINTVVSYFAQREDYERFGGGPWVTLEAAKVFEDFATSHKMPTAKVACIFETLRSEGMLQFEARSANGYISMTLSAHRYYTVIVLHEELPAYYGAAHKYRLRYFHVRAGSAEYACLKVNRLQSEDGELEVQSVVEGLVPFEAPPERPPLVIESL